MFYIDDQRLIPAPFVTINKSTNLTDDNRVLSSNFSITARGTLVPSQGSPSSTGWHISTVTEPAEEGFVTDTTRFHSLLSKQDRLQKAFAKPGVRIRYEPQGQPAVEFYPITSRVAFTPGSWVIRSDYEVTMEADRVNQVGATGIEEYFALSASGLYLSNVSDDLQIRERQDVSNYIEINRTVSATSSAAHVSGTYNNGAFTGVEPWKNARTWVLNRISSTPLGSGDTSLLPTGFNWPSGFYDLVEEESIDRVAGGYTKLQKFAFHTKNYYEHRTLTTTVDPSGRTNNLGTATTRISLRGKIQGLAPATGNIVGTGLSPAGSRLGAAVAYWESINGTPALNAIAGADGTPISTNYTYDEEAGAVNYSVEWINNSGTNYTHTYNVQFALGDNGFPSVSINGQINGLSDDDFFFMGSGTKLNRAISGWVAIEPTLKSLAFAHPTVFGGTGYESHFADNPINKTATVNAAVGSINYNHIYGWKDGGNDTYTDSYDINLSTENAPTGSTAGLKSVVVLNGVIQGISTNDRPEDRNDNAATAWGTVEDLLYVRASGEYSKIGTGTPVLRPRIVSKTVSVNRTNGTIGYSATFNNFDSTYSDEIAVQDVTVEDNFRQDIFAPQIIPGRLPGPIIQDIGTKGVRTRNINIALTMYPKNGNGVWSYADASTPRGLASGIITGLVPAGSRTSDYWFNGDSETWDWKNGFYTRVVNITY